MRRNLIVVLLLVIPAVVSVSQVAYKGLKWGDSSEKVQESVPDLQKQETTEKRILQMQLAMFFLHRQEFGGNTPDPVEYEEGQLSTCTSEVQETTYWFVDDRLVGIGIFFLQGGALGSLQAKYGKINRAVGSLGTIDLYVAVWTKDSERVVVWTQILGHQDESVAYFDKRWFQKLEAAALQKRKQDLEGNQDRLD